MPQYDVLDRTEIYCDSVTFQSLGWTVERADLAGGRATDLALVPKERRSGAKPFKAEDTRLRCRYDLDRIARGQADQSEMHES